MKKAAPNTRREYATRHKSRAPRREFAVRAIANAIKALDAGCVVPRHVRKLLSDALAKRKGTPFSLEAKMPRGQPMGKVHINQILDEACEYVWLVKRQTKSLKAGIIDALERESRITGKKPRFRERTLRSAWAEYPKCLNLPTRPISYYKGTATVEEMQEYEQKWQEACAKELLDTDVSNFAIEPIMENVSRVIADFLMKSIREIESENVKELQTAEFKENFASDPERYID